MSKSTVPDFAKPQNNRYPGYRLGYPEDGRGSIGSIWRRIGGVAVDWGIAYGLGYLFFEGRPVEMSATFLVLTTLSIMLMNGSIGHLLFGLTLTRLDGSNPGVWRPALRQLLLCLVIPALVWDTDHRGGHDILTGLALRRRS